VLLLHSYLRAVIFNVYFATDCMLKTLYFHISVEYENRSSFSWAYKSLKPVALKCSRMKTMAYLVHAVSVL